ncbi:MAG: site-specific integrase [Dorea sp.]|nr:site-specific integrase [Dorea sp.]
MPRRGENIRKRKDGRWEGRYYTQEPESGRSVLHSVYAKTYGEVKEKLSEAKLSAKKRKEEECHTAVYFHTVAEEWLQATRNQKKHATYTKYRIIYETHIREKLGNLLFSELTEETVIGVFQNEKSEMMSDSLHKSISCVLNQILSYAVLHYQVPSLRYSSPRSKTFTKPVEILNLSEQERLLRCLYDGMDACKLGIIICISTGLRLGEICSLKWNDIDFAGKMLQVNTTVQRIAVEGCDVRTTLLEGEPKSICSKREIPLPDELVKLLLRCYDNDGEYVINKDKPMEPRTYQNKFRKYLEAANVKKKNFHILRHTFATNCVSSGMDIKCLSEILGHSDVKITLNRYVHPTAETKRQHMNSVSAIYGRFVGQEE